MSYPIVSYIVTRNSEMIFTSTHVFHTVYLLSNQHTANKESCSKCIKSSLKANITGIRFGIICKVGNKPVPSDDEDEEKSLELH